MDRNKLQIGTKLSYWHAEFPDRSSLCYAEVIKIGKKKIQVRDEWGNVAWKYPGFFTAIVDQKTWEEIVGGK